MGKHILAICLFFLGLQPPAVLAQMDPDSTDVSIQQDFANFDASLDSTGTTMQNEYDASQQQAAARQVTNMQAAQDTQAASERAFQNTQEEMIVSGGAYNSQGFMWGSPWGGMGGGGFGMGGNDNLIPSVPGARQGDDAAIRAPQYGSHNSVLSKYYGNLQKPASRWYYGQ